MRVREAPQADHRGFVLAVNRQRELGNLVALDCGAKAAGQRASDMRRVSACGSAGCGQRIPREAQRAWPWGCLRPGTHRSPPATARRRLTWEPRHPRPGGAGGGQREATRSKPRVSAGGARLARPGVLRGARGGSGAKQPRRQGSARPRGQTGQLIRCTRSASRMLRGDAPASTRQAPGPGHRSHTAGAARRPGSAEALWAPWRGGRARRRGGAALTRPARRGGCIARARGGPPYTADARRSDFAKARARAGSLLPCLF